MVGPACFGDVVAPICCHHKGGHPRCHQSDLRQPSCQLKLPHDVITILVLLSDKSGGDIFWGGLSARYGGYHPSPRKKYLGNFNMHHMPCDM